MARNATSATLFTGGKLWSPAEWAAPRAADLLVRNGRIVALGTDLAQPADADVVDLAGGTLLPAFADGHAHPLQAGLEALFAPVRGESIESILTGVREWATEHPDAEWIYGGGFDLTLASGGVFDSHWLDAVVADRPVVLHAMDYHTLWCNSEALRRAGLTSDTPEPADGEIVRRPDGSPIGTLREWGATDPVFAVMPEQDPEQQVRAIDHATKRCAAAGLTWIQDAWVDPADAHAYVAAAARGALNVRVNLALRADPATWRVQVPNFTGLRAHVDDIGHPRLTARTVKFFVDGVIESGTAAMLEPYLDCAHSRGLPNWQQRELVAAVAAFSAAGFQVHLHAIGDAAIRNALDAIEASADVIARGDLRPVIAHLQVIDPADLGRFSELGVIACFQPLWAQPDSTQEVLTTPRIGPERAALQYPMGTLSTAGALLSFGSDWPVTDLAPLAGIATAVTRQTPGGEPEGGWYPHERMDLRAALRAYTRGTAALGFRDDAGLLEPGSVADLVWLGVDLTTSTAATVGQLRESPVLGTWLAGERI